MFLREVWGCGYAAEACAAALNWFADALPGTANERAMRVAAKLGFAGVERFEQYGAPQCRLPTASIAPPRRSTTSSTRPAVWCTAAE